MNSMNSLLYTEKKMSISPGCQNADEKNRKGNNSFKSRVLQQNQLQEMRWNQRRLLSDEELFDRRTQLSSVWRLIGWLLLSQRRGQQDFNGCDIPAVLLQEECLNMKHY